MEAKQKCYKAMEPRASDADPEAWQIHKHFVWSSSQLDFALNFKRHLQENSCEDAADPSEVCLCNRSQKTRAIVSKHDMARWTRRLSTLKSVAKNFRPISPGFSPSFFLPSWSYTSKSGRSGWLVVWRWGPGIVNSFSIFIVTVPILAQACGCYSFCDCYKSGEAIEARTQYFKQLWFHASTPNYVVLISYQLSTGWRRWWWLWRVWWSLGLKFLVFKGTSQSLIFQGDEVTVWQHLRQMAESQELCVQQFWQSYLGIRSHTSPTLMIVNPLRNVTSMMQRVMRVWAIGRSPESLHVCCACFVFFATTYKTTMICFQCEAEQQWPDWEVESSGKNTKITLYAFNVRLSSNGLIGRLNPQGINKNFTQLSIWLAL